MKSIYIHLPFCKTKCPYCDFASFAKNSEWDLKKNYIEALVNEINHKMQILKPKEISTIFFGGGTPSIHSPEEIALILNVIKSHTAFAKDIEISMEVNPGTIDAEKLQGYIELGVNRISFGAQTFDEKLLEKLGRGHSLEDSYQTIEILESLKLKSWSFDLIYGLPGQTMQSWQDTVNRALSFNPKHISAYALSIETNTPYGDIYKNSFHQDLPQEDLVSDMYLFANDMFEKQGLKRYEISNWAQAGFECQHNLTYWKAAEYLACGLSSHGYLAGTRYSNTRDLQNYIQEFSEIPNNDLYYAAQSKSQISLEESNEEKVLLGLRLVPGLDNSMSIWNHLNQSKIKSFVEEGLIDKKIIKNNNQSISLTSRGALLSNTIISELLIR